MYFYELLSSASQLVFLISFLQNTIFFFEMSKSSLKFSIHLFINNFCIDCKKNVGKIKAFLRFMCGYFLKFDYFEKVCSHVIKWIVKIVGDAQIKASKIRHIKWRQKEWEVMRRKADIFIRAKNKGKKNKKKHLTKNFLVYSW